MDQTLPSPPSAAPHRALILRLLLAVAMAFSFGFALVPLYDVFCQATGFNGKTGDGRFSRGGMQVGAAPTAAVDVSRVLTVEFTATVMPGLPWDVRPLTPTLDMHPGELQTVRFLVSNRSGEAVTGHAVPSVSPGQAAQHFNKVDCFCFTEQKLLPGEAREMAVAFMVKPEIDVDVRTVTLAYAFFRPPAAPLSVREQP